MYPAMDGQQIEIRTYCQNDKCGAPLKFSVLKYGRVQLSCPKCMIKQAFSIAAAPAAGAPPAVTPLGLVKIGPQPEPPERPKPPVIDLEEELTVLKQANITCPHCGAKLKFTPKTETPNKGKDQKDKVECNKCKGLIGYVAVSKTVIMQVPPRPHSQKRGKLVKVNGFLRANEVFKLRDGKNVIGRFDHASQSDIAISGDPLMSRRSVEIEVKSVIGGYTFKFTVLQATNPVMFNKKECGKPFSREIRFGDTFVLGKTTFRFEADE